MQTPHIKFIVAKSVDEVRNFPSQIFLDYYQFHSFSEYNQSVPAFCTSSALDPCKPLYLYEKIIDYSKQIYRY